MSDDVTLRREDGEEPAAETRVTRKHEGDSSSSRLGMTLVIAYAIHASVHLARHEPYDLLWACHIAALLVAIGSIARNANANAVGFLWSLAGNALWIVDLATGGDFMPTSVLTHIGALAGGFYGVRKLGMPRFAALKALGAYAVLWLITRLVTPPEPNINLAYRVWTGWEKTFPSYPLYFAMLLAGGAIVFLIGETLTRKLA